MLIKQVQSRVQGIISDTTFVAKGTRPHKLVQYDGLIGPQAATTEQIRTLRAWLRRQGNIRSAAEALHIHPNTFRYRMERLREAAPIDIDDPDVRLVLELQLRGTA